MSASSTTHPSRCPSRRSSRRAAPVLFALWVLLALLVSPLIGRSALADERSDRESVRQKKAAAAANIDGLRSTDDQLEAAVATLNGNVRTQRARLNDAQNAVATAEAEEVKLANAITEREAELAKLGDDVKRRAVELYVNPSGRYDRTSVIFEAKSSGEAVRKQALVSSADSTNTDTIDRFRSLRAQLEEDKAKARDISEDAARKRNAQAQQTKQVETALADQQRAQQALDNRIAQFQREVDGLAAEDARLTALIQRNEAIAAERARAEQERREADARAAAARSAAPTSAASPGSSTAPGSSSSAAPARPGPAPPPPTGSGSRRVIWPTSGMVTSEYGTRWGRLHAGIDIAAPSGTPIVAAASGTVISAGWNGGGYGNLVVIDHGGGFSTAYAHQSRIATSVGQTVSQGQLIGYVGTTGSSTGDHLHFECRINGSAQNPRNFL